MTGYRLLHQGARAMARVEGQGIRIDVAYLEDAIIRTKARVRELEAGLRESDVMKEWRRKFQGATKLGSRDQLAWVLTEVLGIELEKTAKGNCKTDEASLASCNHPFITDYLRIGKLRKAVSTYLLGIQKEVVDGFIHPFFNLHTVATFRSSADSPNFQNIPVRDPEIGPLIRRMFIPRKGHELIEADYGGIEVRIAACYHRDPVMLRYIDDPTKDLHQDMTGKCYLLPKGEVTPGLRYLGKNMFVFPQFYGSWHVACARSLWGAIVGGVKTTSGKVVVDHLREKGITCLGAWSARTPPGPGTFMNHLRKVEEDFWGRRFKVYGKWKEDWYAEYQERGFLELLTGFTCRGHMRKNEVINYPVQGSAFHCLLWSLIRLVLKDLPSSGLEAVVVGQVHDSIVGDVPVREVDEYRALVEEVMVTKLRAAWDWIITPLEVEFSRYPVSWAEKAK